jgi:SpoVK/Ycf46/Vps4 family AAA+-type ATPase
MIEIYTKDLKLANDVEISTLVEKTEGYSGSDFHDIFQAAQTRVAREVIEGGHATQGQPRPITMDDLRDILRRRKPSVSQHMLSMYDKWFETYKAL